MVANLQYGKNLVIFRRSDLQIANNYSHSANFEQSIFVRCPCQG